MFFVNAAADWSERIVVSDAKHVCYFVGSDRARKRNEVFRRPRQSIAAVPQKAVHIDRDDAVRREFTPAQSFTATANDQATRSRTSCIEYDPYCRSLSDRRRRRVNLILSVNQHIIRAEIFANPFGDRMTFSVRAGAIRVVWRVIVIITVGFRIEIENDDSAETGLQFIVAFVADQFVVAA